MPEVVEFGTLIYLKHQDGKYFASFDRGVSRRYNWPRLRDANEKVALQVLCLDGYDVTLRSGDTVKLKTDEARAGDYDTLGRFVDSFDCYYWTDGYNNQNQGWKIDKVGGHDGDAIHYEDAVTITNLAYIGQQLGRDTRPGAVNYVNTQKDGEQIWTLKRVPARDPGEHEWLAYYDKSKWSSYYEPEKENFPSAPRELVREGCHPRIMEKTGNKKAIVLVHGLTDSPYFMTEIAEHFFTQLNYNVYIPLLKGHGLRIPSGMEGVALRDWHANVKFAVDAAAEKTDDISIGGLSTGGGLSYYEAENNPKITGALYLFSAALDIAGDLGVGNAKEYLLRTFMADVLDSDGPLIGANPYRYARMDNDGARELSKLIQETDRITQKYSPEAPFPKDVFAAHSESDTAADIKGIEALRRVCNLDRFRFFRIQKQRNVSHASLVLKTPVERLPEDEKSQSRKDSTYYKIMLAIFNRLEAMLASLRRWVLQEVETKIYTSDILEESNPLFGEMMQAVTTFDELLASKANHSGAFQLQALRDRLGAEAGSILPTHQQTLANAPALIRYATISQASYFVESNPDSAPPEPPNLPESYRRSLEAVGCHLIEGTALDDIQLFNGLQAMCVEHNQGGSKELIVAYRGTEKSKFADLAVDGGIVAVLCSFTGDNYVRDTIQREIGSQLDKAVMQPYKATVSGQVAARLINAMIYFRDLVDTKKIKLEQYDKVTVVGHSLGGLIAAHVAYWANKKYGKKIDCHTFNSAPGAKYTLVESDKKCDDNIANRIINHRIVGDSVSAPPYPIDTDSEGFPYAHIGYVYNWRPFVEDTVSSIAVHGLERFIADAKCETQHLVGISPAPVGRVYW